MTPMSDLVFNFVVCSLTDLLVFLFNSLSAPPLVKMSSTLFYLWSHLMKSVTLVNVLCSPAIRKLDPKTPVMQVIISNFKILKNNQNWQIQGLGSITAVWIITVWIIKPTFLSLLGEEFPDPKEWWKSSLHKVLPSSFHLNARLSVQAFPSP